MSDQAGYAIFYALLLVLPLSALIARRIPLGRTAVMALAWIGIFAIGLITVALINRNEWLVSGTRELFYGRDQSVVGIETRIPMADDGHFYARATIDGVERRMLIDSGATTTALSDATAAAAGVKVDTSLPEMIDTANGMVKAYPARVGTLKVGGISASDLSIVVAREFGETDVLGMNFLSKLKAWRVEGRTLVLLPQSK